MGFLAGPSVFAQEPQEKDHDSLYRSVTSFSRLEQVAQLLAERPFEPPATVPIELRDLNYEQYMAIQFNHKRAIWLNRKLPFWLETFLPGFIQNDLVEIYEIGDSKLTNKPINEAKPILFDINNFKIGPHLDAKKIQQALAGNHHAGFKIAGRFPAADDPQEMLTFLGASYFRSHSRDTVYGASARGLAIDIALNQDEEFPKFRAHWVIPPAADAQEFRMLSHLDSPTVSGAYEFRFTPGNHVSTIHVKATLFFRHAPQKLAIAPLTGMWIWGDGLKGPQKDHRPSVHDSEGLLIHGTTGGSETSRWFWRPFARQSYPSTSFRAMDEVEGFGVMQRDRTYSHYNDSNARYDKRPTIWIKPDQPWTGGRVELLELPGAHEGIDNIGAYWVSNQPLDVQMPIKLNYTVSFLGSDFKSQGDLAVATHFSVKRKLTRKHAEQETEKNNFDELFALPRRDKFTIVETKPCIEMEIRFKGKRVAELPPNRSIGIDARLSQGTLGPYRITKTETGDCLVAFEFYPDSQQSGPIDMELTLVDDGQYLSETFSYLCPTEQPEFSYPQIYTRQE